MVTMMMTIVTAMYLLTRRLVRFVELFQVLLLLFAVFSVPFPPPLHGPAIYSALIPTAIVLTSAETVKTRATILLGVTYQPYEEPRGRCNRCVGVLLGHR